MSPILVRPVREQFEHDRVIRTLQAKFRRRFAVQANPGDERNGMVRTGGAMLYPDLVLAQSTPKGRVQAIVEVETAESINHLEAMAQWVVFGRSKIPFHLYVPVSGVDAARRLCTEHDVTLGELWSYYPLGEQIRFTPIIRAAAPRGERAAASDGEGAAGRAASAPRTAAGAKRAAPTKTIRKAAVRPPAKRAGAKKAVRTPVRSTKRTPAGASGRSAKATARKATPRKGSATVKRLRSAAKRK